MPWLCLPLAAFLIQEQPPEIPGLGEEKREEEWRSVLAPPSVLYRPYIADPRQSRSNLKLHFGGSGDSNKKVETSMGFYHAVLRWETVGETQAIEVAFEAGAFSRFDLGVNLDQDATDYRFGWPVAWRIEDVTLKLHLWHLSSHLGDEYIERTGRKRRAYAQNELAFGVSWDASDSSRWYGECGLSIIQKADTDSGRVQVGYEWVSGSPGSGVAPFIAFDVSSRNDTEWTAGKTVMFGLFVKVGENLQALKFGLELYEGPDRQTQFLEKRERTVSLVFSMNLF